MLPFMVTELQVALASRPSQQVLPHPTGLLRAFLGCMESFFRAARSGEGVDLP